MKITIFIITFLLMLSPTFGQTYSIVKSSVYGVSTIGTVIGMANTSIHGEPFEKGSQVHITEAWGFNTVRGSDRAHMFFSNKLHIWVGGKTMLWVDNVEQFVDKDEKGNLLPDSGGFVANLRLHGNAEFKIKKITDEGSFTIMTNSADIEVKSTWFYVSTNGGKTTNIECYEGEIIFTNSINLEVTKLSAGNSALVFGNKGDLNTIVTIYPLTNTQLDAAKERLTDEEVPEWKFSEPRPKTP